MTVRAVDALVIFSPRYAGCVAFYRAMGVPLVDEQHGSGPRHAACELSSLHFAVYPAEDGAAPGRRCGGATQVGFAVDDLTAVLQRLRELGADVLQEPEAVPWGRRAVVADPDGRAVELNQAS